MKNRYSTGWIDYSADNRYPISHLGLKKAFFLIDLECYVGIFIVFLASFVLLCSLASAQAREIGNAYNPSTGQTIYYNQDSNGVNAYDPSSGQTVYYQMN